MFRLFKLKFIVDGSFNRSGSIIHFMLLFLRLGHKTVLISVNAVFKVRINELSILSNFKKFVKHKKCFFERMRRMS